MRDRLYRSRDERIIGGVAGGVAEWLDIDPAIVRIVWALLIFAWGLGFLLYLIMWFVVPEEPEGYVPGMGMPGAVPGAAPAVDPVTGQPIAPPPPSAWEAERMARSADREARRAARRAARAGRDGRGAMIFGVVLIVAGAWFLAKDLIPDLREDLFGPATLILLGIVVMVFAIRRPGPST